MGLYYFKTPQWLKFYYPNAIWSVETDRKEIYLTFDDGPTPKITDYILHLLKDFDAGATFFCVGTQVALYPKLLQNILSCGHKVGNHTYHHLNGWKTKKSRYLRDIEAFEGICPTSLFRPPYGKMTRPQHKAISKKIVMWSHMAGDFDQNLNLERSKQSLLEAGKGSILVFHDNLKSFDHLRKLLPVVLRHFSEKGYMFKPMNCSI